MQTIIAQFANISQAHTAVEALLERKYDRDDISFVASEVGSDAVIHEGSSDEAAAGQASLGLLLGFGSLMIPYVGPLLAAGPLAVGLAGAVSGVVQKDAHWLSGALGGFGVPDVDARRYGAVIEKGGALVVMGARDEVADNIIAVLEDAGSVDIDTHVRDPNSSGA